MSSSSFTPDLDHILTMAHSHVHNYVIPGLTSSLIGEPGPHGCVRLFRCSREQQESVTPHSHRFNFNCMVLRGRVTNRIWREHAGGDAYQTMHLDFDGDIGKHVKREGDVGFWVFKDQTFEAGQTYSMPAEEVHSIRFSRDAAVLFFEGPALSNSSIAIEPYVKGCRVPTSDVLPWMFKRD
jgi:hypothetical protein